MPRSIAAHLADVIDACDAIATVLTDVELAGYQQNRTIRSAVEREFILIGEAIANIRRTDPRVAERISHARMIVGFRNVLTHDYAAIDDESVFGVATSDLAVLRQQCVALLDRTDSAG